jgi:CMP-N-acetylneuraminic acid synthetase
MITALLPMKGHSERVPNKNMKDFCGSPLYHVIVKSLLKSKFISEIIINTDSVIIKRDILKHFPLVKTVARPETLLGDTTPMNDIIAYDISQSKSEHFIQTHSTNPLLTCGQIDRAIDLYLDNLERNDSLFSVTKIQKRLYDAQGLPLNHNPEIMLRTQDIPPVFEENSCFFIFSKTSFFNSGHNRVGKNPLLYELNKIEATDIDEPIDFTIAEALYKLVYS